MDIEYYRNFIAIVEQGSISAAAKCNSIAKPALSNQLKILQAKFGAPLINVKRGSHKIEVTDAGYVLYNKAKFICSSFSRMTCGISPAYSLFSVYSWRGQSPILTPAW